MKKMINIRKFCAIFITTSMMLPLQADIDWKKVGFLGALAGIAAVGFYTCCQDRPADIFLANTKPYEQILEFNYERDHDNIQTLCNTEKKWLFEDEYGPLEYHNDGYSIKVLHVRSEFKGFITYRSGNKNIGYIELLAVTEKGYGYGKKLFDYALNDLKDSCELVWVAVKSDNGSMLKLLSRYEGNSFPCSNEREYKEIILKR